MPYDPTTLADWQISEAAESGMPAPREWAERLGLTSDEVIPMGRISKLDFLKIMERLGGKPDGKYIDVTAILLIPMTEFSMGLTGDINDIMNAHNLATVALTARMQHERNYSDEQLDRLTGMRRLDVDPTRVEFGWVMDYCAQALRDIIIGIGGRYDGFMMQSKFGIAVSSELMAILAIVNDLADLRQRLGEITLAFDKRGNPVTTEDLEVAGAMCAWMRAAVNPTLCCTAEHQPCMVHAGPFANIAVGQSS
ncbi:MAG: formate--tetrahydrofolate ligase, partial [Acidobacteriota bacterium]